ncbi:hypothetical protein MPHO_28830 [Mycolicibacterium phocaicum]|nr:hypothetical protein MPHO_28830 [Mycolicibacterium phocaicum]
MSKAGLINAITAAMIDVLIDHEIRDFFNGDGLQFNENELKVIAFALGDTYYQQDTKSSLVEVIKQCIESDYVVTNDDVTAR